MLLPRKYFPEARKKADEQSCPDCWGSKCMEYAADNDNVLVCEKSGFSCEDYDLEEAWIEAYLREYGVEYLSEEDA